MSTGCVIKILKKGLLMKCSKYLGKWNERYCVLTTERFLTYNREDQDADCTMDLFLKDIFDFSTTEYEDEYCFSFKCDDKIYRFKAESKESLQEWETEIKNALNKDYIQ